MLWFSRSHYTCLKDWSCQSLHTNTLTTLVYFCISCTNTVESWCLAILLLITSAKKHRKSTRIWLNYCILPAGIKNKGHTEEKAIQRILYHREQVRRDNHIQASQPTLYFQHFFFSYCLYIYKGLWTCECKTGNTFSSAEFSPPTFYQLHFSPHSYSDQTTVLIFSLLFYNFNKDWLHFIYVLLHFSALSFALVQHCHMMLSRLSILTFS